MDNQVITKLELNARIRNLRNELKSLLATRKLFFGESLLIAPRQKRKRNSPSVAAILLELLSENPEGLRYSACIDGAAIKRGEQVSPKTVSSSLSALKKNGRIVLKEGIWNAKV